MEIRYEDAEATRLMTQIRERGRNLPPLLAAWGERGKVSIRQTFLAGGRPAAWPALKPVTGRNWLFSRASSWTKAGGLTKSGQAAEEGRKPLIDKGMRGGLMGSVNWRLLGGDSVGVGSDKPYAAIHHFGGTVSLPEILPRLKQALFWPGAGHPMKRAAAHDVTIPARPWLVLQPEDWTSFRQSALQYCLTGGA